MKQKYTLIKDSEAGKLVVKEFGELDKEIMSLLCEESFDQSVITAAIDQGEAVLIAAIRSDNLYPPSSHAQKISEAVVALYASREDHTVDITFDDKESLTRGQAALEPFEDSTEDVDLDDDDESEDLDDLLEDEDITTKTATSAIKIAEDDAMDVDDES